MRYLVRKKSKSKKQHVAHIWDESSQNTFCKLKNSTHHKASKYELTNNASRMRICKVCKANRPDTSLELASNSKRNAKFRDELKQKATPSEIKMQRILTFLGVNFKFQKGFYSHDFNFIVDFYIPRGKWAIEVDGDYHNSDEQKRKDAWREQKLQDHRGCRFIRFKNEDVNITNVKQVLVENGVINNTKYDFKVTKDFLEQGKSINGAWSGKQFKALGIKPYKGWRKWILGAYIPKSRADKFLELKDKHIKK